MPEIRIFNGALEEEDDDFDLTVLRGTIDQECIRYLNADWYQRSQGFSEREIKELAECYFQHKKITDITVGMRGERYRNNGTEFFLLDKCYLIDGGQRVWAAKVAMEARPNLKLRLGVKLYFNTTEEIEIQMFNSMNTTQQRVSASVLLRNKYKESAAAKALYDLNTNSNFALKERIGWNQTLTTGEIFRGFGLAKVTAALHSHKGAKPSGHAYDLLDSLDCAVRKVGATTLAENAIKFFDVVDQCWTIRDVKDQPCLNQNFLTVLARLFSTYSDFWDGDEFYFAQKYKKKLVKFDAGAIAATTKQMKSQMQGTKDFLFELLRQKLGLAAINANMPFSRGATVDNARAPRA